MLSSTYLSGKGPVRRPFLVFGFACPDRLSTDRLATDKPPAGLRLPPRPGAGPDIGPLLTTLMRREIAARLARLGLDDDAAPNDIADLRSGLRLWRRLRRDMVRPAFGWCAKGLLVLAAMGLLLAGGLWG